LGLNIRGLAEWKPLTQGGIAVPGQYTAVPGWRFWQAWRNNKFALREAGVSVTKSDGNWVLTWSGGPVHEERRYPKISPKVHSSLEVPAPEGLRYRDFQRAAVEYLLDHKRALLADEPGLGKTIEAIGLINSLPEASSILIVCPAGLRLNWAKELNRWLTRDLSVGIVAPQKIPPPTDILIIGYEMAIKHAEGLRSERWHLVVVDESHYCKNPSASRTRALFGGDRFARPLDTDRWLLLTGTPVLNRPHELWTTAKLLDPRGLGSNWKYFHERYCDAFCNEYGWDISGASNLKELHYRLLSTFMLRRTKRMVLKELPRKVRQIIELEPVGNDLDIVNEQLRVYERYEQAKQALREAMARAHPGTIEYETAVANLTECRDVEFSEMSRLRHLIGLAKVPHALEIIDGILKEEEKLVVFTHHRDVCMEIAEALKAVTLMGATTATERREQYRSVEAFQNDRNVRVLVGTIKAAGHGYTMTAASRVVFVEQDWVPSILTQCEDRLHRIGQRDTVLIQHLVFDGSLDSKMLKDTVAKQEVIDEVVG